MKRIALLLAAAALLGAGMIGIQAAEATNESAPAFELVDLNGNSLTLAQHKGKVVVMNFWATWCPPCRAEIPHFVETFNAYKDKGLVIIGVSLDQIGPEDLASFVKKYKMSYAVAYGTEKIVNDYEVGQYIPETITIDKRGRIRDRHVGYMDKDRLIALFNKLNAE